MGLVLNDRSDVFRSGYGTENKSESAFNYGWTQLNVRTTDLRVIFGKLTSSDYFFVANFFDALTTLY